MVRYTLALRGTPESPETAIMVEEKYVDIYVYEQLSEKFLLQVNPKGQVSPLSYHPIKIDIYYYIAGACGHFIYTAEPSHISLEITYFLCKRYPQLSPSPYRKIIARLLKDLHAIQYLSLSFSSAEKRAEGITIAIDKLLGRSDLSDEYRAALVFKRQLYVSIPLCHLLVTSLLATRSPSYMHSKMQQ